MATRKFLKITTEGEVLRTIRWEEATAMVEEGPGGDDVRGTVRSFDSEDELVVFIHREVAAALRDGFVEIAQALPPRPSAGPLPLRDLQQRYARRKWTPSAIATERCDCGAARTRLSVDFARLPARFLWPHRQGGVVVAVCDGCGSASVDVTDTPSNAPTWVGETLELPSEAEADADKALAVAVGDRWEALDILGWLAAEGTKLGGWAAWVGEPRHEPCPHCSARMQPLLQLEGRRRLHVVQCPYHRDEVAIVGEHSGA